MTIIKRARSPDLALSLYGCMDAMNDVARQAHIPIIANATSSNIRITTMDTATAASPLARSNRLPTTIGRGARPYQVGLPYTV